MHIEIWELAFGGGSPVPDPVFLEQVAIDALNRMVARDSDPILINFPNSFWIAEIERCDPYNDQTPPDVFATATPIGDISGFVPPFSMAIQ